MDWADRLFISVLLSGILGFVFLTYFVRYKNEQNYRRINVKLMDIQDIASDLKNFARLLNAKNATANIQFENNPDVYLMEKTYKMALISDVIETKAMMMEEAVIDALKELQPKPKFCETL